MRHIKEICVEELLEIDVLMLDTDGVTVEKGTKINSIIAKDKIDIRIVTKQINSSMTKKLIKLSNYYTVCISSGRSMLYLKMMYDPLIKEGRDIELVSENGLFSFCNGNLRQNVSFSFAEDDVMKKVKGRISVIESKAIIGFEPKEVIITLHCLERVAEVESIMQEYKDMYCLWNGEAYDICFNWTNKSYGVRIFTNKGGNVLAVGDGPNDKEMLEEASIGVTTNPNLVLADYCTLGELNLGGEEVVDYILKTLEKRGKLK